MTAGSGARPPEGPPVPERTQLLAHDIRSAVSDVIGGVRLMDADALLPEVRTQLHRVQSASELLARLVEELLEGTPRDTVGPVGNLNLRRFVDDELRRWHGAAQGLGVTVTSDWASDVPEIVQLPLLPLRRVAANLMSNALRHSRGNRVTLETALTREGLLQICVQDNGEGLPEGLVSKDALSGDAAAGRGMGLRIAAAHAESMGGDLLIGNNVGGGGRVSLRLPRAVWAPAKEASAQDGLPDLSGVRVLVADDSDTNRLLVKVMLTQLGAECEFARDGIEALNWLARERFDLALIDVEMPVLGGLDVMRSERLRQARGIAPPTSLVAITAYVVGDNREAIMAAGADGILSKPLGSIAAFGAAVQHFIRQAPEASDWHPEDAAALSAATLSDLMLAAGPEEAENLLARLREDLRRVEKHLSDALAVSDMGAVEAQTHVLLSLSSAIGALPTQETARRLNALAREGQADAVQITGKLCLGRLAALNEELAQIA